MDTFTEHIKKVGIEDAVRAARMDGLRDTIEMFVDLGFDLDKIYELFQTSSWFKVHSYETVKGIYEKYKNEVKSSSHQ